MKKLKYLLSAVVLLSVLATIGCGKDDGPSQTAEEKLFDKISGTWTAGTDALSVTFEDTDDRTTDYAGFTLTLGGSSDANYTFSTNIPTAVANDRGPFNVESSGTWTFTNEITDANPSSVGITRSDNLLMTLFILSDTQVRLEFNFVDENGDDIHDGRDEAISGAWSFTLNK